MSDSNADQQEPSMEEILASIRRIISEDGEEESAADDEVSPEVEEGVAVAEVEAEPVVVQSKLEPAPAPLADIDDDILELTDVIEDGPEPETEPEPDSLLDGEPAIEIEYQLEPEPAILIEEEKLVSDEVEEVSVASMSGLTAALAANALVGNGDKTLEQLVKDVLRPILKEWLDTNLPETVERIVREEVERIADRARK